MLNKIVSVKLKVCEQSKSENTWNFCSSTADTDGVNDKSGKDNPMTEKTVDATPTSMPCVVVKTKQVEDDCPSDLLESNVVWVKIKDISLTTACWLTNGEKLSDKHIT